LAQEGVGKGYSFFIILADFSVFRIGGEELIGRGNVMEA